jgi:hypothetical protein
MSHSTRGRYDEQLLAELAAGKSLCDAAAAAGVSERTARRRWADDAFRAQVLQVRADVLARASGQLMADISVATKVLHELMEHNDPRVRHQAAYRVITLAVQISEVAELERRMERLEKLLGAPPCLSKENEPCSANDG